MSTKPKENLSPIEPLPLAELKRRMRFVGRNENGDETYEGTLNRDLARHLLHPDTNPSGQGGNRTLKAANLAKLRHELVHNFDRRLSIGNLLVLPHSPQGYKIESLQHRSYVVDELDLSIPMTFIFSERSIHGRGAGTKADWTLKDLLQHYGVERAVYAAEMFAPVAELTTMSPSHLTPRQSVELCYAWPGFLEFSNQEHKGSVYYRGVVDAAAYFVFLIVGSQRALEFKRQVRTGVGAGPIAAKLRAALEDIRHIKAAGGEEKRTNLNTHATTIGLFYALKFAGAKMTEGRISKTDRAKLRKDLANALSKTPHGRMFACVSDEVTSPGACPTMRKEIDNRCPIK